MKTYTATLEHNHGYSEAIIEAADAAEALAKARSLVPDQFDFVEHYEIGSEIRAVFVEEEDAHDEADWCAPDYLAEIAAPDLVAALLKALPYVESALEGPLFRNRAVPTDLPEIRAALRRAGVR